ncbi:MAG: FAD-binding protein, partial [Planctomycetota bacterium]
KFVGEDPAEVPMKIFPGVHYSMGGLWTTYTAKPDGKGMVPGAPNSMMTNIDGLFAFGEANYQYHGANRLGANALLSCIFDGLFCGAGVANFVRDRKSSALDAEASLFSNAETREHARMKALVDSKGGENPYAIAKEMGDEMTAASTVVKDAARLQQARTRLANLRERFRRISLSDTGMWTNQNLSFARATGDMLILAEAMIEGGLERKESRGSHFRTDFPNRDDANFLRTTVARFDPESTKPVITFEPVPLPLVEPRARTYGKVGG